MANQEHEEIEDVKLPFDVWYTLLQSKALSMGLEVDDRETWKKEYNEGLDPGEAILKVISGL